MSSFSNRPGYGGPLPASSDYEAVGYPGSIPRAPRMPHFPEPSGRGMGHQYNQTGPFQPYHSQRGTGHPIPAPPSSLSPVAMASARSAVATGPQQTMDAGPSRPSAKAGMSILFAGAIIGGLIGAVMHARQNAADAFAAAQAATHEVAPPMTSASVAPPISSIAGGTVILPPPKEPVAKDDKKDDKKDEKSAEKDKKKKPRWAFGGARPSAKTTEASADKDDTEKPDPPAKKTKKGANSNKDDDGYTIASAGNNDNDVAAQASKADKPEAPSKSEKSDKADRPSKKDKGGDKAEASSDKPAKKSSGKSDDAVNVLKAAMGATENTL